MNNCSSSDQNCQENCFYKGTSSAQSTASTMFGCWNSYCADASDFSSCVDNYCYDETHECPLWTNTDCPSIYECLNNGGSDECVSAGSNEGQNRFWDLYNCTSEYCSGASEDSYSDCAYSYCSNEIYKCGFRDQSVFSFFRKYQEFQAIICRN